MSNVLAVGIATVDIISTVAHFPAADDELRATSRQTLRGGNATNTLVSLSQLGHQSAWAGTIADDSYSSIILEDLLKYQVNCDAVVSHDGAQTPLSCITVDSSAASRSIIHYRDLPEYDFEHFSQLDLSQFDWIHFEGRNPEQTFLMLSHVRQAYPDVRLSLEVEKKRDGIEVLFAYPDIIMFSRSYVSGYDLSAPEFLKKQFKRHHTTALYCAWGEQGAWAIDVEGEYFSPALKVSKIVDTTGAGDVFNAAVIASELDNLNRQMCLDKACALAARKCAVTGFTLPLKDSF